MAETRDEPTPVSELPETPAGAPVRSVDDAELESAAGGDGGVTHIDTWSDGD